MPPPGQFWEYSGPVWDDWPGASATQIRLWEQRHWIRLPATLANAFIAQNGGTVNCGENVWLHSLQEIRPLSAMNWDGWHSWDFRNRPADADLARLFLIGSMDYADLVLDYRNGPEPTVTYLHRRDGEAWLEATTDDFDAFLATLPYDDD